MIALADDIDDAIALAVSGLRGAGYSWAEIGSRLGITRQAAQQRWSRPSTTAVPVSSDQSDSTSRASPGCLPSG